MRAAWLHTQLIRALVTCILFCPLRALGSPTVSVSLRASFDAPPFLLELLSVIPVHFESKLTPIAKPPQKRMRQHTSRCSTRLRTGDLPKQTQIKISMSRSYKSSKMMDTSQPQNHWHHSNSPSQYILLRLGLKRTINSTTAVSSPF